MLTPPQRSFPALSPCWRLAPEDPTAGLGSGGTQAYIQRSRAHGGVKRLGSAPRRRLPMTQRDRGVGQLPGRPGSVCARFTRLLPASARFAGEKGGRPGVPFPGGVAGLALQVPGYRPLRGRLWWTGCCCRP